MPKFWGNQIFSLGSFPEVGQKQKKKRKRNDGNNNGQLRIANATLGGTRKAAGWLFCTGNWIYSSIHPILFLPL